MNKEDMLSGSFWPGKAGRHPLQGWPKNPSQCCSLSWEGHESLASTGCGAFTPDTVRCPSVVGVVRTQFNCRTSFRFLHGKGLQERGNAYIKENFPLCDFAPLSASYRYVEMHEGGVRGMGVLS